MIRAVVVAAARVVEERVRTSPTLRKVARSTLRIAAGLSREARDYVRIRVRRIV